MKFEYFDATLLFFHSTIHDGEGATINFEVAHAPPPHLCPIASFLHMEKVYKQYDTYDDTACLWGGGCSAIAS